MTILHVLHRLARKYRDGTGITQLALDMGVNQQVLINKLNPNTSTHHLYAEEIDDLVAVLDTDEVAKYFAAQRNMFCVKSPGFDGLSDGALLDLFVSLESEKAQWLEKMKDALSDGNISTVEAIEIEREYGEFIATAAEMMARIRLYAQASEERAKRLSAGSMV